MGLGLRFRVKVRSGFRVRANFKVSVSFRVKVRLGSYISMMLGRSEVFPEIHNRLIQIKYNFKILNS